MNEDKTEDDEVLEASETMDTDDVVDVSVVVTKAITDYMANKDKTSSGNKKSRPTKEKKGKPVKEKKDKPVGLFTGIIESVSTTMLAFIVIGILGCLLVFMCTVMFPRMSAYSEKQLEYQISPADSILNDR